MFVPETDTPKGCLNYLYSKCDFNSKNQSSPQTFSTSWAGQAREGEQLPHNHAGYKLQFTSPQAIVYYTTIASKVFTTSQPSWKDDSFKASAFEQAIKDLIEMKLSPGHGDDRMRDPDAPVPARKRLAVEPTNIFSAHQMSHMESGKKPSTQLSNLEAVRATSTAPRLFKRILIGESSRQLEFVDGTLGCNNLIRRVIAEAIEEFEEQSQVGCILGIGTGVHRVSGVQQPNWF
ncbi:hypothetical protein QBC36DRAFT_314548 [Triangularia setosa]|uniref:Uncharacterized protein n=1 Tax=Triangularia setosa TaxID=2587417 RepID=A0AAN6W1W3_9PEZI|nr:hypothetical protein QBC36DRAFT_314548 [Podospora setosa]